MPASTVLFALMAIAANPLVATGQEPPPVPTKSTDSGLQAKEDAERARRKAEDGSPAIVTVAPLPRAERPTLTVMAFGFGAVTNQASYGVRLPRGSRVGTVVSDPAALAHEDNENLGVGIADLVKSELAEGGSFRILERLPAEPGSEPPRARLLLTGTITRFGTEDKLIGGGGLVKKVLGGVGMSKKQTAVELTAQILDAATGEVLLAVTGFGISRKGGGLVVLGGSKDGITAGGTSTQAAASAIGEATRIAAQDLAAKLTDARDVLLVALR